MNIMQCMLKLACNRYTHTLKMYYPKWCSSLSRSSVPKCISIHPRVKVALKTNSPVVALESAIITHGMKYPFNYQTALDVESVILKEGAVPATIGIINGHIYVGLSEKQIEFLSTCKTNCTKVSRRDLPFVISEKMHGGTTVAGTMVIAHMVGIPIFVTGGIGGVHKEGHVTMDVSADLTELGRTPLAVVSAGVKGILDVEKTLEYLETQGVCVVTIGTSKAFPDLFTRDSGFESPYCIKTCMEAAHLISEHKKLNMESGILLAVPVPSNQEADGNVVKKAIDQALRDSTNKIRGREVTPFVLQRVSELTGGKSLLTNIDLIKNNAKYGAKIAIELKKLGLKSSITCDKDVKNGSQPVG